MPVDAPISLNLLVSYVNRVTGHKHFGRVDYVSEDGRYSLVAPARPWEHSMKRYLVSTSRLRVEA